MLTIYSTQTCVWCKQVAKYLTMKNIQHETVYIDDDIDLRTTLAEKTGHTSVPVTTDGKTYVVGWNLKALNELIAAQ